MNQKRSGQNYQNDFQNIDSQIIQQFDSMSIKEELSRESSLQILISQHESNQFQKPLENNHCQQYNKMDVELDQDDECNVYKNCQLVRLEDNYQEYWANVQKQRFKEIQSLTKEQQKEIFKKSYLSLEEQLQKPQYVQLTSTFDVEVLDKYIICDTNQVNDAHLKFIQKNLEQQQIISELCIKLDQVKKNYNALAYRHYNTKYQKKDIQQKEIIIPYSDKIHSNEQQIESLLNEYRNDDNCLEQQLKGDQVIKMLQEQTLLYQDSSTTQPYNQDQSDDKDSYQQNNNGKFLQQQLQNDDKQNFINDRNINSTNIGSNHKASLDNQQQKQQFNNQLIQQVGHIENSQYILNSAQLKDQQCYTKSNEKNQYNEEFQNQKKVKTHFQSNEAAKSNIKPSSIKIIQTTGQQQDQNQFFNKQQDIQYSKNNLSQSLQNIINEQQQQQKNNDFQKNVNQPDNIINRQQMTNSSNITIQQQGQQNRQQQYINQTVQLEDLLINNKQQQINHQIIIDNEQESNIQGYLFDFTNINHYERFRYDAAVVDSHQKMCFIIIVPYVPYCKLEQQELILMKKYNFALKGLIFFSYKNQYHIIVIQLLEQIMTTLGFIRQQFQQGHLFNNLVDDTFIKTISKNCKLVKHISEYFQDISKDQLIHKYDDYKLDGKFIEIQFQEVEDAQKLLKNIQTISKFSQQSLIKSQQDTLIFYQQIQQTFIIYYRNRQKYPSICKLMFPYIHKPCLIITFDKNSFTNNLNRMIEFYQRYYSGIQVLQKPSKYDNTEESTEFQGSQDYNIYQNAVIDFVKYDKS